MLWCSCLDVGKASGFWHILCPQPLFKIPSQTSLFLPAQYGLGKPFTFISLPSVVGGDRSW